MLIQKRNTNDNHHTPLLNEAISYVNKRSYTAWSWLHPRNYLNPVQLTRNGFVSQQAVNRTETSQAIQQQGQAKITVRQFQGRVPVTLLHLCGDLDSNNYLDVIATAQKAYEAGTRNLIFDMQDVPSLGLSSVVALHNLALLLRGEQPPDPTMTWQSLRPIISRDLTSEGLQTHFKLLNPQPQVEKILEQWSLTAFLEIHTDIQAVLASF